MSGATLPARRLTNHPKLLQQFDRWIVFDVQNGQKVPLIPGTGTLARCNDASTWRTYEEARAEAERRDLWLGSALGPDLDITFVDIDGCFSQPGELEGYAGRIVGLLDSFTEVSVGGHGVHVLVSGRPPKGFTTHGVEVYPRQGGRFILLTGDTRPGLGSIDGAIEERSHELATLFPTRSTSSRTGLQPPRSARVRGALSDVELNTLEHAFAGAWIPGQRHFLALAIAGWLGKNGVSHEQVRFLMERLSVEDGEHSDRLTAVDSTFASLAAGENVTGCHLLNDLLDAEALRKVKAVVDAFRERTKEPSSPDSSASSVFESYEPVIAGIRITDVGNAEALATRIEGRYRAVPATKTWLRYQGGRWQPDVCGSVMVEAKRTILDLYRVVADAEDRDRQRLLAHLQRSESAAALTAMTNLAMCDPRVATVERDFDAKSGLLNVQNGTLVLEGDAQQ